MIISFFGIGIAKLWQIMALMRPRLRTMDTEIFFQYFLLIVGVQAFVCDPSKR